MGNYGSTLLGKGDKHDDIRALQRSRLALYQQILERAKSRAEARSSLIAETDEYEPESKLRMKFKGVQCADQTRSLLTAETREYEPESKPRIIIQEVQRAAQPTSRLFSEAYDDDDDDDDEPESMDPADYDFHFENLVLKGGGAKGIAYCGAIKYLEEIGLMKKITRLAGTSAGALVALMFAVGYNSDEVKNLNSSLNDILLDVDWCPFGNWNPFNITRTVKKLFSNYGVHSGTGLYDYLGEKIKEKGLDLDITFQELFEKRNITLCIIITNLSEQSTEYCHPKTTPDMPIRMAARISMSYPGVFTPIQYPLFIDEDWFVDGGLLCNYPIHCFDGWFLSMKTGDAFINRIQSLADISSMMDHKSRFQQGNDKTLGMMVHSDSDDDVLKWRLDDRPGCKIPEKPRPLTSLYKKRVKDHSEAEEMKLECINIKKSADNFIQAVRARHDAKKDTISLQELEEIFNNENMFSKEDGENLFGENPTPEKAFEILDRNKDGLIHFSDLVSFIYDSGIMLQKYFYGNERIEITGLKSFAESMISSMMLGTEKTVIQESDLDRTVGINTGYVGTLDFKLDDADCDFLVERGYNGARAFFQTYIAKHPDKVHKKVKTA